MQTNQTVPSNALPLRLLVSSCAFFLFLMSPSMAQSGRRSTKQEPPPAPIQTAPVDPEAPRPPVNKPAAPVMPLIVGFDRMTASMDTPSYMQDYVYEACIARLHKSTALSVSPSGDMSRKQATDRAKLQKEAHVVWFEVAANSYQRGSTDASIRAGDSSFFIEYVIFSPETGKVKKFGRVYPDQVRGGSGRVGVSIPSVTGRLPIQYRLQLAGEEIADRIMTEFHIPLPD